MCLYACVYVKLMPENKLYKEIWSTTYLKSATRNEKGIYATPHNSL